MISLILSESSLELVPSKLKHHPSVISHARKIGKRPSEILLATDPKTNHLDNS